MKIFLLFFISINTIFSQEIVQIGMGVSYEYDIYYSFEDGITAFSERNNWELAFSTDLSSGNIRINSGSPVNIYEASQNLDNWLEITSLESNYQQLRNSNLFWEVGAFINNYSVNVNSGWGTYTEDEQSIIGEKIYIIDYPGGQKKIRINSFNFGVFNFTIANLDGSNEEEFNIDVNSYQNKKFIYYSIDDNLIIDREPDKENWDLLFSRYEEEDVSLNKDTMPYIVTGVLTNNNLTYQFNGPVETTPGFEISNFNYEINTIGYDWKEYNGSFVVLPDLSYYIFNQDQTKLFKIVFESFSGQSSGNLSFYVEGIDSSGIFVLENHKLPIKVFPNPSNGFFNLESEINNFNINIFNLNGKKILSKECVDFCNFDLTNFSKGVYILNFENESMNVVKKIIIE